MNTTPPGYATKNLEIWLNGNVHPYLQIPYLILGLRVSHYYALLHMNLQSPAGLRVLVAAYSGAWTDLLWHSLRHDYRHVATASGSRMDLLDYLLDETQPRRVHFQGYSWIQDDETIRLLEESWHVYTPTLCAPGNPELCNCQSP